MELNGVDDNLVFLAARDELFTMTINDLLPRGMNPKKLTRCTSTGMFAATRDDIGVLTIDDGHHYTDDDGPEKMKALAAGALLAATQSHAPYSGLHAGAALLVQINGGTIHATEVPGTALMERRK